MQDYVNKAETAICAVVATYDYARSAEKMGDPNCSGKNNQAWKEGPYLSSPANKKQINREHAYCFRSSIEFQVLAGIIKGDNPERSPNGGIRIPLPEMPPNRSRVEPVLAKLAIIEQFELFNEFMATINGPVNKEARKEWERKGHAELLKQIKNLVDRRNELTHDYDCTPPTMKEAIEYFYELRQISALLFEVHTRDNS